MSNTTVVAGSAMQTGGSARDAVDRGWRCDEEGWWSPMVGGRWLERLQFKFTEGADEDPYKIDLRRVSGPDESKDGNSMEDFELALLVNYLSKATSLKVAVHVGEEVTLERALNMAREPVPRLECLEIQCYVGQTVIDSVLDAMKSHKFLRIKTLKWVEHNSEEAQNAYLQKLAEVIGADMLPHVSNLDLSFDHYNASTGVENLADSLRCAPSLRVLRIRKKFMGMGHSALADVMQSGRLENLETLSLIGTDVKDHCQDYERAFKSGGVPRLQELQFCLNQIDDKGAEALRRAFVSGKLKSLAHVDLSKNLIGNDGLSALAEGFMWLPNLKKLDLQSNNCKFQALESLCAVLASGRLDGLESLDLRYNRRISTPEGALALVDVYDRNNKLTVTIDFDWEKFPQLGLIKEQRLKRNRRHGKVMAALEGREVQPTFGRVNICGNQGVGKTTLQKSLRRSKWESVTSMETRRRREVQTRGIDVSQVRSSGSPGESTTLVLWDMAGQDDFHLVHNAFLPDSTFAQGKATIFVVVCKSGNDPGARGELEYWLKFIASSSGMSNQNRRHVLVVINRFNNDPRVVHQEQTWRDLLEDHSNRFQNYLEIHPAPFILDARKRSSVSSLKTHLIEQSRRLLTSVKVPVICQFIQSRLSTWSDEKKDFRVLKWQELVSRVNSGTERWRDPSIDAACRYLHAAGVVLYICRESSDPAEGANSQNLLVLDPNWFLTVVVGNLFLPRPMASLAEQILRERVDKFDGSISIRDLKEYLESLELHWRPMEFQDLVEILITLGFCYRGRDENMFFPALIPPPSNFEDGVKGECWGPNSPLHNVEGQWVMGFSIVHQQNDQNVTVAPMALWHKFQVAMAQKPEYNGQIDDDFLHSKNFVTFKCNHMAVLIEATPSGDRPTFDGIDILVKPFLADDILEEPNRKLCQVDLAWNIEGVLLNLWNQVCPGVSYSERVVWPWPASWNSRPRSEEQRRRNVEVAEVKRRVNEHGVENLMQWMVGSDRIAEGQLLSTRDKESVLRSVEASVRSLREEVQQAEKLAGELGIFPDEIDRTVFLSASSASEGDPPDQAGSSFESADLERLHQTLEQNHKEVIQELQSLKSLGEQNLNLLQQNLNLSKEIRLEIENKNGLLRRVQELGEMMFQDKEHSCPRFVYLRARESRSTIFTFKTAMSPTTKVRLQFLCEARYNDHGQHPVPNQQGVDVSGFKDWARKLAPCLKLSVSVLLILARVAAHVVAPGLGAVFPSFVQWQEATSVSEGVALATGFSQHELDIYMKDEMLQGTPKELHRYSKKAMSGFLENMKPRELEEKLGLERVRLCDEHRAFQRVAWICHDCHDKYKTDGRVL